MARVVGPATLALYLFLGSRWAVAAPPPLAPPPSPPPLLPAAEELVREARSHESAHEDDVALRRYAEALALDPTLGDAYLGLGALRLRMGDARESERVFSTALSRVPALRGAWLGRGRARHALGARREAEADLLTYVATEDDPEALLELASWYSEEAQLPAQLAAWRRLLSLAERRHDARLLKEARLTVHALERIVDCVDPVRAPLLEGAEHAEHGAGAVRRGLARIEQRR